MAADKRENPANGGNDQFDDSSVFDIFFIENEDGDVVVTTENPNKEEIPEEQEPFGVTDEPSEQISGDIEEADAEPDEDDKAETDDAEAEKAPETDENVISTEPESDETAASGEEDEDLDSDSYVDEAVSGLDDTTSAEELDENLENIDEESGFFEENEKENAKTFADPFESPLDFENIDEEKDKEVELFGENLDAEIQAAMENDSASQAFLGDIDTGVVNGYTNPEADSEAASENDEKPENENVTPSGLEKLKQGVDFAKVRDRWKDSDGSNRSNQKTVLGISYKIWAVIIASLFTLDAVLANVVCHWGIYFVVDKLLRLSGVAALKLEADSYRSFSIVISYVVSFILGGFLMFILMNITKRLLSSVEISNGAAIIKTVLAVLTLIFAVGLIVCLISGHSITTFVTFRFGMPLFMYLGAFIFYALSNVRFNQDY